MPIYKMAWRNIWRNKRRTGLSIAVFTFSVAILIILMSNINGLQEQIIESSVTTFNGYIQVNRKGYHGNESLAGFIEKPDKVVKQIKDIPGVKSVTSRIQSGALISYQDNSVGCLLVGIEPEDEPKVTIFYRGIKKGRFLEKKNEKSILISTDMAKRLMVDVDSEVTLLVQSHRGSLEAIVIKVVGLFDLGNNTLNQNLIIVPINIAASLTGYEDRVSQIVININSDKNLDSTVSSLRKKLQDIPTFYSEIPATNKNELFLDEEFGDIFIESKKGIEFEKGFEVLSWREVLISVVQFIQVENTVIQIVLVIVFIAVFLIIFNVLLMSIMERRKEFGVMKAIGTKSKQLIRLIVVESLLITSIGMILGAICGVSIALYLYLYPIDLAVSIDIFNSGMLRPKVMAILSFKSVLQPMLFALSTGFLASLLASWNIAKLTPIEAIHSH